MCGWLLNSMKTSGPLPDWIAEVTRGCRSLPFTVSRLILTPSAFIASGSICLRSSSSDAGTKSFHLIQCTVPCWANTGGWCDARIPARPAPEACRNLRRVKLAIVLLLLEGYAMNSSRIPYQAGNCSLSENFVLRTESGSVAEHPRQPERQ